LEDPVGAEDAERAEEVRVDEGGVGLGVGGVAEAVGVAPVEDGLAGAFAEFCG
jgi:hypothetical protein